MEFSLIRSILNHTNNSIRIYNLLKLQFFIFSYRMEGKSVVTCLATGYLSDIPSCVFDGKTACCSDISLYIWFNSRQQGLQTYIVSAQYHVYPLKIYFQIQLLTYSKFAGCRVPEVKNGVWLGKEAPGEPLEMQCDDGYLQTLGIISKSICIVHFTL